MRSFIFIAGESKYNTKESLEELKMKIGNLKVDLREEMVKEDSAKDVSKGTNNMLYEPRYEKTSFLHICENKDADQLRSNSEADQRLCFRYTDSTIPLLPTSNMSSL